MLGDQCKAKINDDRKLCDLCRVKFGVLIHEIEAKSLLVRQEWLVNCFLKAVEGTSHY